LDPDNSRAPVVRGLIALPRGRAIDSRSRCPPAPPASGTVHSQPRACGPRNHAYRMPPCVSPSPASGRRRACASGPPTSATTTKLLLRSPSPPSAPCALPRETKSNVLVLVILLFWTPCRLGMFLAARLRKRPTSGSRHIVRRGGGAESLTGAALSQNGRRLHGPLPHGLPVHVSTHLLLLKLLPPGAELRARRATAGHL
jgi:hypothetical protein